jgi:hypothetical protein
VKTLVILDETHLNPQCAVENFVEDAVYIFAWDKNIYNNDNYSLKRLVFIYEYLIEIEAVIYDNNLHEVIEHYTQHIRDIVIYYPPSLKDYFETNEYLFHEYTKKPLLIMPTKFYKRFFPFWKAICCQLLPQI